MKNLFLVLLLVLSFVGFAGAAVDVNTATQAELETVRGIGPALSARIMEARKQGAFKDIDDLQQRVKGIGEASARKLLQAGLVVGTGKSGAGGSASPKAGVGSPPAAGSTVTSSAVGKGVVSEVKPAAAGPATPPPAAPAPAPAPAASAAPTPAAPTPAAKEPKK